MKEVLVDANVLVSFLTDRNKDQQERAAALLLGAREREHSFILHSISVTEAIYVLRNLYKLDPQQIAAAIRQLMSLPGVVSVSDISWSLVFERWPDVIPNLGDAILAAVAAQEQYDAVATFDTNLRKKLVKQGSTSYWPD
ncbi:MAG TPA: PIN domain-containing protein [Thermoanaerobaculia bacterium]|nr:PIN domain-containing protein [Thermoanaerobaculia bacterium]